MQQTWQAGKTFVSGFALESNVTQTGSVASYTFKIESVNSTLQFLHPEKFSEVEFFTVGHVHMKKTSILQFMIRSLLNEHFKPLNNSFNRVIPG